MRGHTATANDHIARVAGEAPWFTQVLAGVTPIAALVDVPTILGRYCHFGVTKIGNKGCDIAQDYKPDM